MSERADKDAMACNKPRRTPGHAKKSHVVKACYDGKQKLIRFGEQGASTAGKPKAGESERMKTKRASFKARHASNIAKGPSSPAYWANKVKWAEGGEVKMAAGGSAALALIEQMRRSAGQSPEFDPVQVAMREQRARPARRPAPQAAPRMLEPQAAQPREAPLPLPPVPPAMRPDENPPPEAPRNPMRFDEGNPHVATAIRMAEKYNLPRDIFLSLVQQESRFNPAARSPRGAIGLGQLMPATARELGVDPLDPEQNLEGSARYLRQMLDRFKDMPLALAAYNAGPGRVARAGNTIPNIRETQQYVPSILRRAGANVPEGYAEGGEVSAYDPETVEALVRSVEEPEGYAEGGRVRRTLRDEMRDIEAEIRGERPASMGVTIARGFGEGAGGITSVARRGAARAAAEPPMIAMHNTRPERLERIGESGAVAPSIAITRADNPFDSFGDVSLLASPQTVDPRRTPVYARDAYTPRYPAVETSRNRPYVRLYNENTGESRLLPHTPENALRVMKRGPWRGGEDFVTDNWLLAQIAPQFRNMSELRGARDRLVLPTDTNVETWTKGLDDLRSEWSKVLSESGRPTDWRFADSLQRNLAEAAQRGPGGMDYINRTYYNNAIPEDLLARTRAHLEVGRELPATYFEAKPRRIVPLNEFEGAVVPSQASQDLTDMLRRYGIEDIQYYASPAERAEQVRRFERLMFGAAPVAAGAALAADEAEPEGYAEGGEVESGPQPRVALNRVRNYLYNTFMRPNDMGMEADARAKAEGIPGGAGGPRDAIRHMIASSYTSPRGVAAVEFLQGDTLNSLVGDNQATWDRANNALGQRLRSVPESERYDRAKDMVLQQLRHLVEYGDMSGTLPSFDPRFTVVDRNAEGREIVYGPREIIGWIESGRMPSLSDDSRVLRSDIYTPGSIGDRLRPASRRERAPASVPATPNNFAEGGLAQLEQKYAEGGEVSAMPYNPDAVDALVKEIEAEYV